MARLGVPAQAMRNFFSILLAFVLGGLNNLVVLPWAFSDDLAEWGLIRVAAAWASLLAPILLFGAPAAMNRYSASMGRLQQVPRLLGTLLWPPIVLFTGFVALPALVFPEGIADMLSLEGQNRRAVRPIAILAGIQTAQLFLAGFLTTKLKTALTTFAQETVFKLGYLCLALALGLGWLGSTSFLPAFVGLHVFVLLVLLAQAVANHLRLDLRGVGKTPKRREIRQYGGALILGSGAWIILNQLDIIMVGNLMGLEHVPAFTVAAFIATVSSIPMRSSQKLLRPLISSALDRNDNLEIERLTGLSHRHLLLGCGWILTCIWVTTPQINAVLPSGFQELGWVILVIGLIKMILSSSTGSGILLAQSDHFKKMVFVKWFAVLLAIPLNFLFIPDGGLGLGLLGAALATLISIGISVLVRQVIIWHIWNRFIPEKRTLLALTVLLLPAVLLMQWNPNWPAVSVIFLKSGLVTLWTAWAATRLNLIPEGVDFAVQKFPWLAKWV